MLSGLRADLCYDIRPDSLDLLGFDKAQEGQEVLLLSDEIPVVSLCVSKYSHEVMKVVCAWRRSLSSGLGADLCHDIRSDSLEPLGFDNTQKGREVLLLSDEIPVVSLGVIKYRF